MFHPFTDLSPLNDMSTVRNNEMTFLITEFCGLVYRIKNWSNKKEKTITV